MVSASASSFGRSGVAFVAAVAVVRCCSDRSRRSTASCVAVGTDIQTTSSIDEYRDSDNETIPLIKPQTTTRRPKDNGCRRTSSSASRPPTRSCHCRPTNTRLWVVQLDDLASSEAERRDSSRDSRHRAQSGSARHQPRRFRRRKRRMPHLRRLLTTKRSRTIACWSASGQSRCSRRPRHRNEADRRVVQRAPRCRRRHHPRWFIVTTQDANRLIAAPTSAVAQSSTVDGGTMHVPATDQPRNIAQRPRKRQRRRR